MSNLTLSITKFVCVCVCEHKVDECDIKSVNEEVKYAFTLSLHNAQIETLDCAMLLAHKSLDIENI